MRGTNPEPSGPGSGAGNENRTSDNTMIAFIEGLVDTKEPSRVVLNAHGVGYELAIPASSFDTLPALGKMARLLVVEILREDSHALVGFATEPERKLFLRLTEIPGIGAKSALALLSHMPIRDLNAAAAANDISRLAKVPGIGKKTAERIALELRGKMSKGELAAAAVNATTGLGTATEEQNSTLRDVYSALIALGHRPTDAQAILKNIAPRLTPGMSVDEILRQVLSGRWR